MTRSADGTPHSGAHRADGATADPDADADAGAAGAAGAGAPCDVGTVDPPDLRLVPPALAAWLTSGLVRALPPRPVLLAALVLAGCALAVGLARRPRATALAAVLLCTAAAAATTAARSEARSGGPVADLAARSAAVTVVGVVVDDPRRGASGRVPATTVVRLRAERVDAGGRSVQVRTPLLVLSADPSWLGLLPSQPVRVEGRLKAAQRGDDVAAVLQGRGPPQVLAPPSAVQRAAGTLRAGLREAASPLPDAEAGLLPGLVVGDTTGLLPEVRDNFRTVGLTHLTAVSGGNVADRCRFHAAQPRGSAGEQGHDDSGDLHPRQPRQQGHGAQRH